MISREEIVRRYVRMMGYQSAPEVFLSENDISFLKDVLTHTEEKTNNRRDEWGNWEHDFTSMKYDSPYADELVVKKASAAGISRKSPWPANKPFAFCLTHDLDVISEDDPSQLRRRYRNKISDKEGSLIKNASYYIYASLRSLRSKQDDPLWCMEKWTDLERSYGFSSTFYIFSGTYGLHPWDCDLRFNDTMKYRGVKMTLADFVRTLSEEGFEIGLHGSFHTSSNFPMFCNQQERIEALISKPVTTTRQHFLHYDIHATPEVHASAGIKTDSTLGFNTATGFRAGTCFPYYLDADLLEVPMIIMDGALFNDNSHRFNEEQAKVKILEMINKVEAVGGVLVVNYHPNYLNRKAWWNTYIYILEELKRRNAHCASMEEISKTAEGICAV